MISSRWYFECVRCYVCVVTCFCGVFVKIIIPVPIEANKPMGKMVHKQEKINPDLLRERQKCTFKTIELTHVLDGGKDKTEERRSRGRKMTR